MIEHVNDPRAPMRRCTHCKQLTFSRTGACPICYDLLVAALHADIRIGKRTEFPNPHANHRAMLCNPACSQFIRDNDAFIAWWQHIYFILKHAQEQGF
jgi:RNA polymerase subunit RPABC4/transcription elongation factor Spt4